jgi:FMN reductase
MLVTVVAGNPKPASRTLAAAELVARRISGRDPDTVIDVIGLGAGLLGWGDPAVAAAVEAVRACDVLIVASPTFKATYTGVLKLFLDQFQAGALSGVIAFPVMLGAGPGHALAPELLLRPVLVEMGASCPVAGLYLLDSGYTDEGGWAGWADRAAGALARAGLTDAGVTT